MNTINLILMLALCTMIGFGIGNAWGKETMKRTFNEVIKQLTNGMTAAVEKANEEKKKSQSQSDF